jgi:hypothetical protein
MPITWSKEQDNGVEYYGGRDTTVSDISIDKSLTPGMSLPVITRQRICHGNLMTIRRWFKLLDVVTVSAGWAFLNIPARALDRQMDNEVRISSRVGCQHTFIPNCTWSY